jgi:4a-hydroxytetrahydrobiopterin dehydratase
MDAEACDLAKRACVPCQGGVPPLKGRELQKLQRQLGGGWKVVDDHQLEKKFGFKTYRDSVSFVNRVADLAEEQNHHPEMLLGFDTVKVVLWTHKIDGLSESDFIFAAKTDQLR